MLACFLTATAALIAAQHVDNSTAPREVEGGRGGRFCFFSSDSDFLCGINKRLLQMGLRDKYMRVRPTVCCEKICRCLLLAFLKSGSEKGVFWKGVFSERSIS